MKHRHLPLSRQLAEINWFIITIMSLIALIGLMMMVSAGNGSFHPWATPQITRFVFAFVLMIALALMPMRWLLDYAYVAYFLCLIVLIGVDILGHTGLGAKRWLNLGGLNIQPSEFMKLTVILVLARYFHNLYPENIRRISFLIPPVLLMAMPAILILREPNLGTTIILMSVGGIMCFLAGVQWRYFIGLAAGAVAAMPVIWHFMHDYQKQRVLTFLTPDADPLGAGYNWLRRIFRQRVPARIAEPAQFFTGKTYRFYFHYARRRIRIFRWVHIAGAVRRVARIGDDGGDEKPQHVRLHARRRCVGVAVHAHSH